MTNTTVTIDHQWYPHIIDEIIKHAPRSSLVKLRATNSVFKNRVNALLCNKLNLRHRRFSPYFTVLAPTGERIPGLQRIPLIQHKFNEQLEKLWEHTKHTQFVEIEGPVYTPCDARVVAPAFPNLDTFRILTHRAPELPSMIRYFPFSCKTVVFFCQELEQIPFWCYPEEEFGKPFHLPQGARQQLPNKVTKFVINMNGQVVNFDELIAHMEQAPEVDTCVLVFPGYSLDNPDPHFCSYMYGDEDLNYFVFSITALAETTPVLSVVIVGLEEVAAGLAKRIETDRERYFFWHNQDSPFTRVTFLSREEYTKQVGDANLELVEYLDGYRACCRCCFRHH